MTNNELERAAIHAHASGQSWAEFWARHGDDVRRAEPWHRARFHALVDRLLHILLAGDLIGHQPIGTPWEADDVADNLVIDDTTTHARLQPGAPVGEFYR